MCSCRTGTPFLMQEMAESAFKGCALKNPEGDFDSPCTITDFYNRANRRAEKRHDKMSEWGSMIAVIVHPLKRVFVPKDW